MEAIKHKIGEQVGACIFLENRGLMIIDEKEYSVTLLKF